jgi:hypothetical protein
MTTPAPAKPKVKRRDALVAHVKISIPLDMNHVESVPAATKAVQGLKASRPICRPMPWSRSPPPSAKSDTRIRGRPKRSVRQRIRPVANKAEQVG